jgi:hypothetical protein
MCCRNGCGKPAIEDKICEDCLVDELVEYAMRYRREDDPEALELRCPEPCLVELSRLN